MIANNNSHRDDKNVDDEIEDFFGGDYVRSFEDGETRVYEFDVPRWKVETKPGYNGGPTTRVLRCVVRDPKSAIRGWKYWDLSRTHGNVWRELKYGNNGKGWTVMEITRQGTGMNTRYVPKGIR
jgi:hypothetical protein